MNECGAAVRFVKFSGRAIKCHAKRTHEVVTGTGIVQFCGCEKHAQRMASRYSVATVRPLTLQPEGKPL